MVPYDRWVFQSGKFLRCLHDAPFAHQKTAPSRVPARRCQKAFSICMFASSYMAAILMGPATLTLTMILLLPAPPRINNGVLRAGLCRHRRTRTRSTICFNDTFPGPVNFIVNARYSKWDLAAQVPLHQQRRTAGLAQAQAAYEDAFNDLFGALDRVEATC
jgi:hypothetical protein